MTEYQRLITDNLPMTEKKQVTGGGRAGSEFEQCPKCGGSGEIRKPINWYRTRYAKPPCPQCNGRGYVPKVHVHKGTAHTDAVSEQLPSPSSEERSD